MALDPRLQIGAQLAMTLAALYAPGSGQTVSALAAIFEAVKVFNAQNGRPADYVPSREEWDAFINERESKRIPIPPESQD